MFMKAEITSLFSNFIDMTYYTILYMIYLPIVMSNQFLPDMSDIYQ